ncbi:MAG: hypothetical protein WKG01_16015 [Kofleriaceae bacterium]
MAPDEPSGVRPAPVVLRIKLRYDDVESMVQRFAPNVGKSGLFLPTKAPQPIGTEVKFELRLNNDQVVLVGLGRVKSMTPADPTPSKRAFGNSIELMRVSPQGRDLIMKLLARRRALGLAEVAIPTAADVDIARETTRANESAKPAFTIPEIPKPEAAAPVAEPSSPSRSTPLPSVMTAPRRTTSPMEVAKVHLVPPLAPEAPRRRRPAVHELIESASGPVQSATWLPGLDDDVDVAAVLVRARLLAGDLEAELAALGEDVGSAAPIEISIDAASAELAKQLGGVAVRRDRSAGWAVPPAVRMPDAPTNGAAVAVEAVIEAVIEPVPAPEPEPDPEPAPEADDDHDDDHDGDRVVRLRDHDDSGVRLDERPSAVRTVFPVEDEPEPMIHADADLDELAAQLQAADEHEVDADQIADEIHQLDESDFEEVEQTQVGAQGLEQSEDHALRARSAAEDEVLANQLEAQLAEAEAEDLGLAAATFDHLPAQHTMDEEVAGFGAQLPTSAPAGEPGWPGYEDGAVEAAPNEFELPNETDGESADDDSFEIDDFEILAEADAEDADLLSAHGEQDVSDAAPGPPRRPSTDFAARLDLGDDSADLYLPPNLYRGRTDDDEYESGSDPRIASAGQALAAFDDPDRESFAEIPRRRFARVPSDPLSGFGPVPPRPGAVQPIYESESASFTIAGMPSSEDDLEFDAPHAAFPPLHEFDQSDVIDTGDLARAGKLPRPVRTPYKRGVPSPPQEADDLENALEALDVDLDDLSIPHAATELPRQTQPIGTRPAVTARSTPPRATATPAPVTRKPKRAVTDDGVMIDFDDEDPAE